MKVAKLLTLVEVLEELQVPRCTFDDWRRSGRGPRMRKLPNGKLRCRVEDLEDFMDQLEEV